MIQQVQQAASTFKVIELSAGGIFAVILVDKVLGWTLKWRNKNNGNPGGQRSPKEIFERPEFIKHDLKSDQLCIAVTKLAENTVAQQGTLARITEIAERQETILGQIRDVFNKK